MYFSQCPPFTLAPGGIAAVHELQLHQVFNGKHFFFLPLLGESKINKSAAMSSLNGYDRQLSFIGVQAEVIFW